ncbi:PIN domain-like protein [Parasitella parasitica]|nr:PIN domain-like protein [Parasitella parasitica]
MGIKGLLESLRPVQKEINISSYKSKTVAIDGHGILHRRGFGAATNLALKRPTDSYITHFMRYIDLFIYHGITPIVVFDGLPLPLGKAISDKRRHRQNDTLKKGHALYKQGKFAEAEKFFQQAVTITDGIIKAIIKKLVAKKVKCIVAPNEADAQLAHFVKTGKADAVVTENSELLAFGCKKCIYKINRHGNAVEISLDQVLHNDASPFKGYDVETFRHICILSGCDYLASLKGVCLETILKQYKDNKSTAHNLMVLRRKLKKDFPGDYNENFHLANLGFLHRWVFDIDEMNYIRSNPLPSNCSRQDMLKLGKIPTVQDSTIFCVNKAIPKSKPKNKPLKEAITEEFIAFVDTVKENISVSYFFKIIFYAPHNLIYKVYTATPRVS